MHNVRVLVLCGLGFNPLKELIGDRKLKASLSCGIELPRIQGNVFIKVAKMKIHKWPPHNLPAPPLEVENE